MSIQLGESARIAVGELHLFPGNPRRGRVDAIASSLAVNGQYKPLVVNRGTLTGRPLEVLAGNHTLMAARKLNWVDVDVWVVDVDEQRAKAIVAADNRLADLGEYDPEALFDLLDGLDDLAGTGYTDTDLAAMRRDLCPGEPLNDPDDVGVNYVGGTKEALTIQNDGAEGLPKLLDAAFEVVVSVCRPGAPVYVAHADTERMTFERSMRDAGLLLRQNLVWVKNALVLGRSDYHYKHEPILEAEAPEDGPEHEPLLYGFTGGGSGRLGRGGPRWYGDNKQSTVFVYKRPARNADHPTMKPVGLIAAMLHNSCPPGGVVFDPFAGSGSTLIAAQGRGVRAYCVELDPRYADVILRRYEEHTGVVPLLDGREVSFAGAA